VPIGFVTQSKLFKVSGPFEYGLPSMRPTADQRRPNRGGRVTLQQKVANSVKGLRQVYYFRLPNSPWGTNSPRRISAKIADSGFSAETLPRIDSSHTYFVR
jgi:hypothetical protein